MVVPSVNNMTRSFINPKDRAAEVAKRRQEFEAELQRRREDRIRQIQERSENAVKRKQMGLQEKVSKHKTETEHLKEISKRRAEKQSQEKQRLQQLLEKKRSPPRTTQSVAKPTGVAFGSRVSRNLDLNKSSSSGRSASTSSANGTLNTTTNSLMTRSVHPVMSPTRSAVKPPPVKHVSRLPPKPVVSKPAPRMAAPPRKAPENRMTRSVHPELCPTPNKRVEKAKPVPTKRTAVNVVTKPVPIKAGARPPKAVNEPKSVVPEVKVEVPEVKVEVPEVKVDSPEVKVEAPETPKETESVVEPVTTQQVEPAIIQQTEEKIDTIPTTEPEIVHEPVQHVEVIKEEAVSNIIDLAELDSFESHSPIVDEPVSEPTAKSIESTPRATEFGQLLNFDSSGDETPEIVPTANFTHTRSSSDEHDSTRTRTITPPAFSDDEHDSGVVPETPSPPIEKESTTIEPHKMYLLNSNVSSFSPTDHEEIETPNSTTTVKTSLDAIISHRSDGSNGTFDQTHHVNASLVPADPEQNNSKESINSNGSSALANGVVIGLTEKLQQERDNRRAKLSEILSRTREQSNSSSPIKSDSDASVLAKNLLARRTEKLNESKQPEPEVPTLNGSEQKLVSLADEFENLSFSAKQDTFLLPGQMPDNNNGVSG